MERTKKRSLHTIAEWEHKLKKLPGKVELDKCSLTDGLVVKFYGQAEIGGKWRKLFWLFDGRCYYKGNRIKEFDVRFN